MLAALRTVADRGGRVLSQCTGAFVLAAAGLLDGRRATTHWKYAAELARRYPQVDVDPGVLYVDEGQVITSAGTAAGIDACLHVIRLEHGAAVANEIARHMVVAPHRDGGQAQFVPVLVDDAADGPDLAALRDWALGHLREPLTVADLAGQVHMSPRTFARWFAARTGTTPHQWLTSQRLILAQELLERTDHGIEQIAADCGLAPLSCAVTSPAAGASRRRPTGTGSASWRASAGWRSSCWWRSTSADWRRAGQRRAPRRPRYPPGPLPSSIVPNGSGLRPA